MAQKIKTHKEAKNLTNLQFNKKVAKEVSFVSQMTLMAQNGTFNY